jgi:hypothetical protein
MMEDFQVGDVMVISESLESKCEARIVKVISGDENESLYLIQQSNNQFSWQSNKTMSSKGIIINSIVFVLMFLSNLKAEKVILRLVHSKDGEKTRERVKEVSLHHLHQPKHHQEDSQDHLQNTIHIRKTNLLPHHQNGGKKELLME